MMSLFKGPHQGDTLFDFDMIHHIQGHCGMCVNSYQNQLPDFLAHMINLHTVCPSQIYYQIIQRRCPKESSSLVTFEVRKINRVFFACISLDQM